MTVGREVVGDGMVWKAIDVNQGPARDKDGVHGRQSRRAGEQESERS